MVECAACNWSANALAREIVAGGGERECLARTSQRGAVSSFSLVVGDCDLAWKIFECLTECVGSYTSYSMRVLQLHALCNVACRTEDILLAAFR